MQHPLTLRCPTSGRLTYIGACILSYMMNTAVSVLEKKIVCKAVVAGMDEGRKNTEPVQVLFNVELRRGYIYLVYDWIVENIMEKMG